MRDIYVHLNASLGEKAGCTASNDGCILKAKGKSKITTRNSICKDISIASKPFNLSLLHL
jgi:hypothetical protein